MPVFRTGIGFDAHRFAASGTRRSLWLACFRWTDDESRGIEGLEGDSDGDVAAHAAIDALLSASNLDTMGFTGRSEGVAAYAVALLSRGERAEKEEK